MFSPHPAPTRLSGWRAFRVKPEATALMYCVCFVTLGMAVATMGPAILQLAYQTNATVTETGYILGIRSFAYLCGGFMGFLYDRIPGHWILGASLMIGGLATALIPLTSSLVTLAVVVIVQGFFMCQVDTGGNIMILWALDGHPRMEQYMQALHFAFALGAFLSPLALRASASLSGGASGVQFDAATATEEVLVDKSAYNVAFYFCGAMCVAMALALQLLPHPKPRKSALALKKEQGVSRQGAAPDAVTLQPAGGGAPGGAWNLQPIVPVAGSSDAALCIGPTSVAPEATTGKITPTNASASVVVGIVDAGAAETVSLAAADADGQPLTAKGMALNTWLVVANVACLMGAYVGAECGYGFYLTAFSVLSLGMTEAEGQFMTAVYWGAIMVGRLLAVPLSTRLSSERMLLVDVVGSVLGMLLLIMLQSSVLGVWISTIVFGLFMASTYPTAVALMDSYVKVEGKHGTAIVLGGASGEWLFPFIIATAMGGTVSEGAIEVSVEAGHKARTVFIAVNTAACVLTLVAYLVLRRTGPALKVQRERYLAHHATKDGSVSETVAVPVPRTDATVSAAVRSPPHYNTDTPAQTELPPRQEQSSAGTVIEWAHPQGTLSHRSHEYLAGSEEASPAEESNQHIASSASQAWS
jgi:fucose permease